MTNRCVLQAALLLCFSITALSIRYDLLQLQQSWSSLESQKLLLQLNGTTQLCLDDRMDFKVPEEIMEPQFQKEDTAIIMYEMLQNIFDVFRKNFSSTGWNKTIVETIYGEVNEQMVHLKTVLEEEHSTWRTRMTIIHLKRYYRRIRRYLENREYSSCAWKVVQAEMLRNFSFIKRLTDVFQN
uniref:interferon beta n=1 Tax=Jaculus jaculus TaxID=51337 RepID=UPI0003333F98|nr:interferon beta [Jaculus jaculus]